MMSRLPNKLLNNFSENFVKLMAFCKFGHFKLGELIRNDE